MPGCACSETDWSPAAVAGRLLRALEDGDEGPWTVDPAGIGYVHGAGLSETRAGGLVGAVVERAGVAALGLEDRPELEAAVLRLRPPTG